jgi:hypothetical protein
VGRPGEQGIPVFVCEVRSKLGDPGQVKAPIGQHHEKERMLARGSGHRDPKIGLGFREVKDVGAVGEHRRTRLAHIQAPLVDLADVRDQIRLDAPRLPEEIEETTKQLVVGERCE